MDRDGACSNAAKDGLLRKERAIKLPEAPQNSAVGSRVAAVQCVAMIEVDEPRERLLVVFRPFKNRLPPGHADVVMQFAMLDQTSLGGIPKTRARLCPRKSLPGKAAPYVLAMLLQSINGPRWDAGVGLQVLSIVTKGVSQLPPNQQFIQVLFSAVGGRFSCNAKW